MKDLPSKPWAAARMCIQVGQDAIRCGDLPLRYDALIRAERLIQQLASELDRQKGIGRAFHFVYETVLENLEQANMTGSAEPLDYALAVAATLEGIWQQAEHDILGKSK